MHFFTLALALSGVVASPTQRSDGTVADFDLCSGTYYNAAAAPWEENSHPGWYYGSGKPQVESSEYPCIGPGQPESCSYLETRPDQLQCPPQNSPPSDGYTETFSGLTGATQADDYLTYCLVDTVDDCAAMCNSVERCEFFNTYHDVNGKDGSTQLTCSMFSLCHTSSDADNRGGQSQPNGSIDYIIDSEGWCHD